MLLRVIFFIHSRWYYLQTSLENILHRKRVRGIGLLLVSQCKDDYVTEKEIYTINSPLSSENCLYMNQGCTNIESF